MTSRAQPPLQPLRSGMAAGTMKAPAGLQPVPAPFCMWIIVMGSDSTRPSWPFKHITRLTAHPGGSWCKKVDGRTRYFGPWRDPDPGDEFARAALRRYLAVAEADAQGAEAAPLPGDVTVYLVANHWLTDRKAAVKAGALTPGQFVAYVKLAEQAKSVLGVRRTIQSLGPADMKRLRDSFTGGPTTIGSKVRWTRGMFNWGAEFYGVQPRYGGQFSAPPKSEVRKARKAFSPFKPAEIRRMLKVATPAVKCFILLGLNCGFGQTDCAMLPAAAVDWRAKMIRFPRPKTGVDRVCPLWPETVKALKAYRRPSAGRPELFFITRWGRPYVSHKVHSGETGTVERATRVDSLRREFSECQRTARGEGSRSQLKKLPYSHTRGFYVLRHIFRSEADLANRPNAVKVIMGHAFTGMDEYYLHLRRGHYRDLRRVVERVHQWLWGR